jgi:hypothetical protein
LPNQNCSSRGKEPLSIEGSSAEFQFLLSKSIIETSQMTKRPQWHCSRKMPGGSHRTTADLRQLEKEKNRFENVACNPRPVYDKREVIAAEESSQPLNAV